MTSILTIYSGEKVYVQDAFEGIQPKIAVKWDDVCVYVCRESEWDLAKKEHRPPISIGFRWEYLRDAEE